MKTSIKTLAAAIVVLGMAGSASAMTYQPDTFSGGNVNVTWKGDVATLSGHVQDSYDRNAAVQAAKAAGAEKVINLITRAN